MSEHGAALQTYNQELVKCKTTIFYKDLKNCLEDLKVKRSELQEIISREESDKQILERNIKSLQDKLTILNNTLNQHRNLRDNYDKAINDTEMGFKKILESSQTLLNLAQHEASKLQSVNGRRTKSNYGDDHGGF